jgi:hypothetical protein
MLETTRGGVMEERTRLTREWLTETDQAMRDRETAIIKGVLQTPDYPPLPACPTCHVTPQRIDSRLDEPKFGQDGDDVLINFAPCGHRFYVPSSEMLRA